MFRIRSSCSLRGWILLFLLAAAAWLCTIAGCGREEHENLHVVTSTTMLEAIVEAVGGERVETTAIIPGAMCPGHFDIKPRQIENVARADLFILCGWEGWAPRLLNAAESPEHVVQLDIPGNYMLPHIHMEVADSITQALVRIDPDGEVFYRYNLTDYSARIENQSAAICESMAGLAGTTVICSELQAEFLDWMGFDIVGTYGRPEDLSPGEVARLIDTGRRNGVRLVVDNLQSGRDAGRQIAEEIGAARVVLTNFPLEGSYIQTLKDNADELFKALGR